MSTTTTSQQRRKRRAEALTESKKRAKSLATLWERVDQILTSLPAQEDRKSQRDRSNEKGSRTDLAETSRDSRYLRLRVVEVGETSEYLRVVTCTQADEVGGESCIVELTDEWATVPLERGDVFNLIREFGRSVVDCRSKIVLNSSSNLLLVLRGDVAVSGTTLASCFMCLRRTIISELYKSPAAGGTAGKKALFGDLVHETIERALLGARGRPIEETAALEILREVARARMPDRQSGVSVVHDVSPYVEKFVRFWNDKCADVAPVVRAEENLGSEMFGLKGKVDLLMEDANPLELKTGWQKLTEHRVQVIVYLLLLMDRYASRACSPQTACGRLMYVGSDSVEMFEVLLSPAEVAPIIIRRNRLVKALLTAALDPPLPPETHVCQTCYQKRYCRFLEGAQSVDVDYRDARVAFFRAMDDSLTAERSAEDDRRGHVVLGRLVHLGAERSVHTFRVYWQDGASCNAPEAAQAVSVGDFVRINTLSGHRWVNSGRVVRIEEDPEDKSCREVDVSLSTDYFPANDAQVTGSWTNPCGVDMEDLKIPGCDSLAIWQIESKGTRAGEATQRNNLVEFSSFEEANERGYMGYLRDTVLGITRSPRPDKELVLGPSASRCDAIRSIQERLGGMSLNEEQVEAIGASVGIRVGDALLIRGMPGSGKTFCITSFLYYATVVCHKRVLVSTMTHGALDNILARAARLGIPCLRVSPRWRLPSPALAGTDVFVLYDDDSSGGERPDVTELMEKYNVVGVTSLSVDRSKANKSTIVGGVLLENPFDVCVVDEASQISVPTLLGPLMLAKSFVLVGDSDQLPPLVKSDVAKRNGLGRSLFETMIARGQACVELRCQYRMCDDLMGVANNVVYSHRDHKLRSSGLHAIASRRLNFVPDWENRLGDDEQWLHEVLRPERAAVVIDADSVATNAERSDKGSLSNEVELLLAMRVVKALSVLLIPGQSVALLSPFRNQACELAAGSGDDSSPDVVADTIDRYQGKESDVVVLSLVRSNSDHEVGEILGSEQRFTVALTRARSKLIVICSVTTLSTHPSLSRLLTVLRQ